MKLTMRTSREDIVKALGANAKLVQKVDKNVYDQMVYTSKALKKDEKSVTKKDLSDLLKEVMRVLGDKFIDPFVTPAVAEEKKPVKAETPASVKKTTTKKESSLKTTKKTKEAPVEKQEAPKTEPAKKVEKPAEKEETPSKRYPVKESDFPVSLTIEGETYQKALDLQDMKSIYKALEDNTELVIAFYWNKRQIQQFGYFGEQLPHPKSFPDNLDLATVIYVSDAFKVAYAVSMYTEVSYRVLPIEVPTFEDGVRFSNGIEYEIYRKMPKEEKPVKKLTGAKTKKTITKK